MIDGASGDIGFYTLPLVGRLFVGWTVTYDNKSFVVVHNDGNLWYLAWKYANTSRTTWGATSYDTTMSPLCESYLSQFSKAAQSFMQNVTVEMSTSKVFLPTYDQCNGGFSLYSDSFERRYFTENGILTEWWTSTTSLIGSSPYHQCVFSDGSLRALSVDDSVNAYFRPHICIKV